jgi:hypothetical protein
MSIVSINPKRNGKRIAVTVKYRPVAGGKVKATLLDENGLRVESHIVTSEATDAAVLAALDLEQADPSAGKKVEAPSETTSEPVTEPDAETSTISAEESADPQAAPEATADKPAAKVKEKAANPETAKKGKK